MPENTILKNNYHSITGLKAVDFFCSGGGMSYGLQNSGIEIIAGIDFDKNCEQTYKANIKTAEFILADVFDLKESDLETKLSLKKNDDNLVLIGCSPCQFWSIINTDKKKSKDTKNLLKEFRRFVEYFTPGYVVVENVPGVLTKKRESGLSGLINWLKKNKYKVHYDVHEVSEYGVPQHRKRFTLIANRITKKKIAPIKSEKRLTVRDVIGLANGFPNVNPGNKDQSDFMHTVAGLEDINKKRLLLTDKNGGTRIAYADIEELAPKCHKNDSINFKDTYGRMWWDRPSPTITTKFFSISNGRFAHPEEDRAISLREGAVLQSFPKNYIFKTTSIANTARMIGNAVPPKYAESIGNAIVQNHRNGAV
ncbi:DNA cytosine methyltransferase [Mucilaginibacter sp. L3T2-6]|uniref:DNA cytosine methyltransferase n=1 Tax=Mucilaginibacter sp. L3T2-6 TaxID=3062491 RepID=UPI00267605E0|nr:DNA cytosine methyltransferase [Mucilaginibacter sp. L3T2-6]MDO3643492.1 DNA cytosine methyltransferase [Mucilaginibacter sp. L3T2-6]MDV6215943.1 DNA cytosine methyltransferase [Mucilaginibacter sp. L3T2-6]